MKPFALSVGIALLVTSATGCAFDDSPSSTNQDGTLIERLQFPTQLDLDTTLSAIALTAHSDREGTQQTVEIDFDIMVGDFEVRADATGHLVVQRFVAELGDLDLPEEFFSPALKLRDARVSLQYPVTGDATWFDGGVEASSSLVGTVVVDWSAVLGEDGEAYPLRPIRLEQLPLDIQLTLTPDGEVELGLDAFRTGNFWEWADMLSMSDLSAALMARAQ